MRRVFEWRKDEEYGEYGWIPTWFEGANMNSGQGLAHDAMEHRSPEQCGPTGELMAQGATHYVRVETGLMFRTSKLFSVEDQFARTIASFLADDLLRGDDGLKHQLEDPGVTRAIPYTDDAFKAIAEQVLVKYPEYAVDYCDEDPVPLPENAVERIVGWMRKGYRWAARTYPEQSWAGNCFEEIRMHPACNRTGGDVGDRLIITINPKWHEVKITERLIYD